MEKIEKVPWVEFILHQVQRQLIKSRFSGVMMRAHPEAPKANSIPTIYYANHSSKWDHHIGTLISQTRWNHDTYVMVYYRMMNAYPILRKAGCFSVDDTNPMEVVRVLNLTNRLLTEAPNRAVWIFPQGGIRPNDARPLNFQPGLAQLVRTFKVVRLVPVAFRYEFLWDSKPFAFVSFGKPLIFTSDKKITTRALTAQLESELCSVLDNLRDEVLGGNGLLLDDVMRSKGIFINRLYVKSQWIKWRIAMNTRSLFSHWIESEE